MRNVFSMFVGLLFLTALLGVSSGWSADKSIPSVPGAAGTAVQKGTEKIEALKGGEKEKKHLIDINSAAAEELTSIKGIGEKRAKKIIDNRPYKSKDDLVQKKVLSQANYDKIKDQIVAKQGKDAAAKSADVKSQVSGAVDSLKGKK